MMGAPTKTPAKPATWRFLKPPDGRFLKTTHESFLKAPLATLTAPVPVRTPLVLHSQGRPYPRQGLARFSILGGALTIGTLSRSGRPLH